MRADGKNIFAAGLAALAVASVLGSHTAAAVASAKGGSSQLLVTSDQDTDDDATIGADLAADQADGAGLSLREALAWALAGDTITFDLDAGAAGNQGGSITLGGSALVIAVGGLRIDGDLDDDGSPDVLVSADDASRVMTVNLNLTDIELTGLELTRGAAFDGGALSLATNAAVTMRDCRVTDSVASGSGGGVYGSTVALTLINTTVSGNTSASFGGGIRAIGTATLNLVNSTIADNTTTGVAQHGGGVQFSGPLLTIVNSTISGNAASGATSLGGGLRITSGTSFVYNSTIVGNAAADSGGGISANGTSDSIINTVVAGNTAGAGATPGAGGSPLASGGAADDVAGTLETATASYFGTSPAITTNNGSFTNQGTSGLLLGDLAPDAGGRVATHFPQDGSVLREAGNNAALPPDSFDLDEDGNTAEALPVDANGSPRVGETVEIGAVETNGEVEIFRDGFED